MILSSKLPLFDIKREVSKGVLAIQTSPLARQRHGRAPKYGLNPRHQFQRRKRFRDVVVGADLQSNDAIDIIS